MAVLRIITDGDGCWQDIDETVKCTQEIQFARLPEGMESGKSSVAIRLDFADGTTVIGETSLELFLRAASIFRGREEQKQAEQN